MLFSELECPTVESPPMPDRKDSGSAASHADDDNACNVLESVASGSLQSIGDAIMASRNSDDDADNQDVVLKAGYLTKRGHVVTNWKTRFVVLHKSGCLRYYADESMRAQLGEVHVAKVIPWDGELYGFIIYTTKGVPYFVFASSSNDRERWVAALADYTMAPSVDADCQGTLLKRGKVFPVFRQRYFVLSKSMIQWHVSEAAFRLGHSTPLGQAIVERVDWDGLTCHIKATSGATLVVRAESAVDKHKWLRAFGANDNPSTRWYDAPRVEGWLTKQGHRRKNWKRRYFVLQGTKLAYYGSKDESTAATPRGHLHVHQVFAWDGRRHGLLIVSRRHVPYFVHADSSADGARWLTALHKALESRVVESSHGSTCA